MGCGRRGATALSADSKHPGRIRAPWRAWKSASGAAYYHLRAVPEKYRDQVDVRAFGTGERIVFLPYTREVFAATREWAQDRDLFPDMPPSLASYDEAALA